VISPFVPRGFVSSQRFDHTSIMKTILLRFAPSVNLDELGTRVSRANHLGALLQESRPRTDFTAVTAELNAMARRLAAVPDKDEEDGLSGLQLELRGRREALLATGLSEDEI
jgi:hypothetical protein